MNPALKLFFAMMMIMALIFGYAGIYFPLEQYDFERLHIFLFNLCTGGTIILYFTEGTGKLSPRTIIFLVSSLFYAFFAFLNMYPMVIFISLGLASIVESLRIERFGILPWNFFSLKESVSAKFHQASLLCLSIGLLMSTVIIINNEYLHVVTMEKLVLNTFFLGFSFPLSLITLSVIFSMIRQNGTSRTGILSVICFWTINLGVIIFFMFILFEQFYPQIAVTLALFVAVVTVFVLYVRYGQKMQQKGFLSSGIGFLIITAISGIVYILFQMSPGYTHENTLWLLRLHTFASLYGWNLCGLAVICRFRDFPMRMHSGVVIAMHWLTALVLAPLGTHYALISILAVMGYIFIVFTLFFSKDRRSLNDEYPKA
ncbi:MAG: hypothetical protein QM498_00060 [Desulfobacterium sp.]